MKDLKRLIMLVLCFCMAFTLLGCGNQTTGHADERETAQAASGSVLIAYFSWADNAGEYNLEDIDIDALGSASVIAPGDVGVIAGYIEERTGADVFKIILPGDCTILQSYDVFEDDVNQAQDEVNEWLAGLEYLQEIDGGSTVTIELVE